METLQCWVQTNCLTRHVREKGIIIIIIMILHSVKKKKLNFAIPRDFHFACSPFIADRVLCIDANIIQLYSCHVRLWPPLAKNNAETESGTNYNDRVPGP